MKPDDATEVRKAQPLSEQRSPCPGMRACGRHCILWTGAQKWGHSPEATHWNPVKPLLPGARPPPGAVCRWSGCWRQLLLRGEGWGGGLSPCSFLWGPTWAGDSVKSETRLKGHLAAPQGWYRSGMEGSSGEGRLSAEPRRPARLPSL